MASSDANRKIRAQRALLVCLVAALVLSTSLEKQSLKGVISLTQSKGTDDNHSVVQDKLSASPRNTSAITAIPLKEQLRLVREENLNVSRSGEKVFSHFLSHIPKTGTSFAMHRVNTLTWGNPEWQKQNQTDKIRACDQATSPTSRFKNGYLMGYKRTRCALWMSEQPHTTAANHVYTIIRNPHSHVLSQYFHCTESRDHRKRAHLMPATIDEWLQPYVSQVQNPQNKTPLPKFGCYNPTNLQSRYVGFDENTTKEILKQRYDFIGKQDQMDKTVCIIFLQYTGYFPPQCNCTSDQRRNLMKNIDHGVTHHGDTFNLTTSQKAAIDVLTQSDKVLYEMVTELFEEKVRKVEEEFGVVLCETIK